MAAGACCLHMLARMQTLCKLIRARVCVLMHCLSLSPHTQVYISPATLHTASINSIAWAPHELGLLLAAGSSDGTISITEYSTATASWEATKVSECVCCCHCKTLCASAA